MLYTLVRVLDRFVRFPSAHAHCDIPCGIYDPHQAQVDAHTVIRMIDLIKEAKSSNVHSLARYTSVKEQHAESCKHQIRILWGDYFKDEHVKQFPNLPELVWRALKQASKTRQGTDRKDGEALLATVQEISEIFWKTKGKNPKRVKAPYPSGGELVLHD
ncbi:superoxide dismutase, Ni [archaeon CG10_big_fil_rev_8_21_14_0_10_43_11]|nr:MAG: superoxide dismutase, Ni [archaeon CG10_big_fil_rev_8_21_14_0_10_43_11]